MSIYDDMQSIASNLLREFDQGGIWFIRMVPGDGPADDPGEPVPETHKLDGAARGVKMKFVDGTNILASDLQASVAVHSAIRPDEPDTYVALTGKNATPDQALAAPRFKVVQIDQVPATGTPVSFRIFFRR